MYPGPPTLHLWTELYFHKTQIMSITLIVMILFHNRSECINLLFILSLAASEREIP